MTGSNDLPADIDGNEITLTVFLKHDQSKPLEEFQAVLNARGWWQNFPPEGVEILSWNVVMGIGQIVTLRLPVPKLQAVNVALEKYAWGVFRTETFISYDFTGVRERLAKEAGAVGGSASVKPEPGSGAAVGDAPIPSGAYGSHHPRLPHNGLKLEPVQSRSRPPTEWENRLADALEAAFGDGVHDLPDLVTRLNDAGVYDSSGAAWTDESFTEAVAALGPAVNPRTNTAGAA